MRGEMCSPVLLLLQLLFVSILVLIVTANHYKDGDSVMLYVNKVGPYHNPQETYHYYQLPVCRPEKILHKSLSLGEVLDGDRMAESMYEINFRKTADKKTLCEEKLGVNEVEKLKNAIEELYYFEFVLDDIPIRGFVGYVEEGGFLPHTHKIGLWTHLDINIEYNGDRIIFANVSVKDVKPFSLDDVHIPLSITHTYSVHWFETSLPYERRGERFRDYSFFPKTLEIHWLSIINSMVLVFLLMGFVVIILMRVLKNDFSRYNIEDEAGEDFDQGDNGWKIIHTDVFRFPPYKSLLCSVLGVGMQFLTLGTGNSICWTRRKSDEERKCSEGQESSLCTRECFSTVQELSEYERKIRYADRKRNCGLGHLKIVLTIIQFSLLIYKREGQ